MRSAQVMREFRDKTRELANNAKVPEVRERLEKLAQLYQTELEKLGTSPSLAPR
jgi:uncharacterized protein YceH (UPF0502 family)